MNCLYSSGNKIGCPVIFLFATLLQIYEMSKIKMKKIKRGLVHQWN